MYIYKLAGFSLLPFRFVFFSPVVFFGLGVNGVCLSGGAGRAAALVNDKLTPNCHFVILEG